jgi:hypothetical protein
MLKRALRWVIWLFVILVMLALVSVTALQLWPFEGSVSWGNCERIKPGMSRAEVHRLFGGPGWSPDCGVGIPPGEDPEFWNGLGWGVRVDFDRSDRVIRTKRWYSPPWR